MAVDVWPDTDSRAQQTRPTQSSPVQVASTNSPTLSRPTPQTTPRSNKWLVRGLAATAVIAMIAVAAPFIVGAVTPQQSGPKLTHKIKRGDLIVSVTEEGRLESSNNTEIKCKVRGGSTVLWVIESGAVVEPGEELIRLDTSTIEDNISQQKIAYQNALATFVQSQSDVDVKKISIDEYLKGTYRSELKVAESNVAIALENLRTAQNTLKHAQRMFRKGYVSKLQLEGDEFGVTHAELDLEVQRTNLDVLQRFTKAKMMEELRSNLKSAEAKLASDKAALDLEKTRLERAENQLENCVIKSETRGMVIYAVGEKWEDRPEMREGAAVREDQVLLLMPNLDEMQVKVQIHEAKIDQIKAGLPARIELQSIALQGEVLSIASVAKPAGWWNGNMVKYETTIKLNRQSDIKPGMSADVKVFLAQHKDVLTIPVGAVLQQERQFCCWVKSGDSLQRRELELGDSDEQFIVVKGGLKEGDEVVLNPLAYIEDAQKEALQPYRGLKAQPTKQADAPSPEPGTSGKPVPPGKANAGKAGAATDKPASQAGAPQISGAAILKAADKNGDGVLTKEELPAKDRANFDKIDADKNGEVDAAELETAIKAAMKQAHTSFNAEPAGDGREHV